MVADLARRPSARNNKRDTLPSTFPKELLRNPFGLPVPLELPPVPPHASVSVPVSPIGMHMQPKTPLSPAKLAAIANALGVHAPSPSSAAQSMSSKDRGAASSRYLLHVIPPAYLAPEDDEDEDGALSPYSRSTASAPGYHTQFSRGVMVPLHPTLQSQLGAIAREYALPSTGGLLLYLFANGEPGPRISDESWKKLWFKALKLERDDSMRALQPNHATTSPTSSYPSPASSEAHGSLDIPIQTSLNLPIIAKVEFDIDRRKAAWFDAWAKARRLRGRPGTPSSVRSLDYPLPLELSARARSRASSFETRNRADTGSSMGKRSLFSISSSDKASADDEVHRVTARAGYSTSTPRKGARRGGPPPLNFGNRQTDSPTEFDEDEDSHLAYRILIDGPAEGEDDLDFLGRNGDHYDRRASHLIMRAKLDSLEKAMHQFSPRVEKFDPDTLPKPSPSPGPSPLRPNNRAPLPSPEAYGEQPSWPASQFTTTSHGYSGIVNGVVKPGVGAHKSPDAPPKLTINGQMQNQSSSASPSGASPLISPDPFATKSSFGVAGEAMKTGVPPAPPSESGSRFSQDSAKGENAGRDRSNSTAGPLKGFKRLWRKSSASGLNAVTGKPTISGPVPVPPMPPLSPQVNGPSMAAQQASFATVSQQQEAQTKRGSDIDPFIFDQEATRYPMGGRTSTDTRPSRTSMSPSVISTSTTNTTTTNTTAASSIGKKSGANVAPSTAPPGQGILKSWRTRSPSVSSNSVNVSEPQTPLDDEQRPTTPGLSIAAKKRPSMRPAPPTLTKRTSGQALASFLAEEQPPLSPRPPPPTSAPARRNYF